MDANVFLSFPVYTPLDSADRAPIARELVNGEKCIVLFTDRDDASDWRNSECPQGDLLEIVSAENLCRYLEGAMTGQTCRVTVDTTEREDGGRATLPIRGFVDSLRLTRLKDPDDTLPG